VTREIHEGIITMQRVGLIVTVCLAALVSLGIAEASAQAQSWPTKPIKAFIPFSAGSATDIVPRAVFDRVSAELGQPIVVENRGGAGGTIAVGAVVKAEPDGYTILANSSAHTVAPSIIDNIPYDTAKDLSAVVALGKNASILVVSPAKGWKTVADLVAAAKAKPGTVTYGSAGVGTATHIGAERFRQSAGFQATHVPYRGGPEVLADIFGGRVDFYYCPIATALPLIRDGRLVALATSTPQRSSALPDVPTTLEAGYANSDYTPWFGVFMPVKTPRAILDKFYTTTMKVIGTPAMQQKLAELVVDPMPLKPAEFDALVETEIKANEKLIKAAGVKAN
jgi:tripartite-type tricarboxylate transporter receptor subunit TctC